MKIQVDWVVDRFVVQKHISGSSQQSSPKLIQEKCFKLSSYSDNFSLKKVVNNIIDKSIWASGDWD